MVVCTQRVTASKCIDVFIFYLFYDKCNDMINYNDTISESDSHYNELVMPAYVKCVVNNNYNFCIGHQTVSKTISYYLQKEGLTMKLINIFVMNYSM